VDAGVSGLLFNADVAPRGPEQETPIDMHLMNASNIYGRRATRMSGVARLIFDPATRSRRAPFTHLSDLVSCAATTAPMRATLLRKVPSSRVRSMNAPDAERLCAPPSSPVTVNVSLHMGK
jgi:hypothetical protein